MADELERISRSPDEAPPSLGLITAQIARLSLAPDDTLVVRCLGPLQQATAERIKSYICNAIGHNKILVVGEDVELTVLDAA